MGKKVPPDLFPEDYGHFDDSETTAPSKTQLKREMTALQKLGEQLVKLTVGELATIPLNNELADAIQTARKIKSREGLRRQMQFIGKLMRKHDTEAIEQAFRQLQDGRKEQARAFHQLEQWRDTLINNGLSAIEDIVERFPNADRQHLRQLILQANKEKKLNKPPAASRKLFKYIRALAEQ